MAAIVFWRSKASVINFVILSLGQVSFQVLDKARLVKHFARDKNSPWWTDFDTFMLKLSKQRKFVLICGSGICLSSFCESTFLLRRWLRYRTLRSLLNPVDNLAAGGLGRLDN